MREISIKELGYSILIKWKQIILISICCVFALIVYQMSGKTDDNTVQKMDESSFTDEEMKQLQECYSSYLNYIDAENYKDNNVIMNIDPYHVNTSVREYMVVCDNAEDLQTIVDSYIYYVSSGAVGTDIGKKDLDVASLVKAAVVDSKELNGSKEGVCKAAFTVEAIHKSEKDATDLADEVEKQITDYSKELNNKIGKHTITCVMTDTIIKSHNTLISWQSQIRSAVSNEKNNYENKKNSLTALQLEYFNTHYLGNESTIALTEQTGSKLSYKVILLDIVASVVAAILICTIYYILKGRINYTYGLQNSYGLRILGVVPVFLQKQKDPVKKWALYKLYGIGGSEERTDQKDLCDNIKYFATKQHIQKIYFDMEMKMQDTMIADTMDLLRKENIQCMLSTDCDGESNKIQELREAGNVVIIMRTGKSTYKQLEKQLALYKEEEINVVGILLVI